MVAEALILVGAGLLLSSVVKTLVEPAWAREVLKNISINRIMGDGSEWSLTFEFIGKGGWIDAISSDYIGWRNTGVGKGDSDAWISIWKLADGTLGFDVYGLNLVVFYGGVSVESFEGAYRFYLIV